MGVPILVDGWLLVTRGVFCYSRGRLYDAFRSLLIWTFELVFRAFGFLRSIPFLYTSLFPARFSLRQTRTNLPPQKHSNGPTQPSSDPSPLPAAHTQQPFSPPPPPPLPHPPIPPQNTPPPARQQQGKSSSLEGAREVRIIMIRMCCARRAGDGSGRGM